MRRFTQGTIYLIDATFTIVEFFLGLRIILKLLGANPSAPFVKWMYETTSPLLNPFANIFPAPVLSGGFVIEFSAVFAMIVYALLGYFIIEVMSRFDYLSRERAGKNK